MSSIVLELQQNALDPSVRVSDLLRKSLVTAKKLGIDEFESWIEKELNGYSTENDAPSYRVLRGQVVAWDIYRGWQPVFFENFDDAILLSKCIALQPIGVIESALQQSADNASLYADFNPATEEKIIRLLDSPAQVTRKVSPHSLVTVTESVRNIILRWSLQMEADGILGDGLTFSAKEKITATQNNYYVTNFFGNVNVAGDIVGRDKKNTPDIRVV